MHTEFKVGIDKTDSLNVPNFEPEERDLWLNKAQQRFILQRYGGSNPKRQSFEETEKRSNDLRELIVNNSLSPLPFDSSVNKTNGVFVDLSGTTNTYWFAVNEEADVTYTDCNGESKTKRVEVKPMQHDDYNKTIKDPFNKPTTDQVRRMFYQDKVELLTDGTFNVDLYHIRYIKKPVDISLATLTDSELSEHAHREIVEIAVSMALENIESRRYQTNLAEVIKQE